MGLADGVVQGRCDSISFDCCVQFDTDLLHPSEASEKRKHKLKRLVQSPNSYFMDVKCPGCFSMYPLLRSLTPTSDRHLLELQMLEGCA